MRPALELRGAVLQAIRRFFVERGFIEVETPVRIDAPALEEHIHAQDSGDAFLRSSPELHMKRLLAAGYPRIFQMGPCFRKGEHGPFHNPEYTMLEWYRTESDYTDMLVDTKALLTFVAKRVLGRTTLTVRGRTIELTPLWERFTVAQAFTHFAGWDPTVAFDPDRFDLDMVHKVEPALPPHCPTILTDYPAQRAALARCKPGNATVAERWELYVAGIELANAFSELTDPAEQRRRFEACATLRRKAGHTVYPLDEAFLAALEHGRLPPSGGVALGVDRLVMILGDLPTIQDVLPFSTQTRTDRKEENP